MGILASLLSAPQSPLQSDIRYGMDLLGLNQMIERIGTYLLTHKDRDLERQLKQLQILAMRKELGAQAEEEDSSSSGPVLAKGIAKANPSMLQSILDFKNPPIAPMGKLFQFPKKAVSAGKASSSLLRNIRFP